MITKRIKIPFYKWKVTSIIIEDYEKDEPSVVAKMEELNMEEQQINNIRDHFDLKSYNGAYCCYHSGKLLTLIIVFPHTSTYELVSTLLHEGRHVADKVIESVGLEGFESAAYLQEYIQMKLIKPYIKDEVNSAICRDPEQQ